MKLSHAQAAMLRRLAEGRELPPGGYKTAGRDASNWYRTGACLERLGFATYNSDPPMYSITDAGRIFLNSNQTGGES